MDLFFVFLLYFIAAIFLATIEKDIYIFLNIYQIKFILSIIK